MTARGKKNKRCMPTHEETETETECTEKGRWSRQVLKRVSRCAHYRVYATNGKDINEEWLGVLFSKHSGSPSTPERPLILTITTGQGD